MNYEPLKPGTLDNENVQMVNWRKYSNSDNAISKYAPPANFRRRIAKDVIKNKENLNLNGFRKTYSKKKL